MAQFLFLYRGGDDMSADSPAQLQRRMEKWLGWFNELSQKGVVKDKGLPLERSGKLVKGPDKKQVTDGPFPEKDLVIGFTLIEARDAAHAAELSMGCPMFEQGGWVEVRPIRPM